MPIKPVGVNVIGYVSGNFGLGIAARSTVARLLAWGHPVAVVDVDPGGGRARRDLSYASLEISGTCPHPVNLFHMNPPQIMRYSKQWYCRVSASSLNVCVPFWEMPHLPLEWLPILGAMDLVLAPTRFIRTAVEEDLPNLRVLSYPQAVSLPEGVRADRQRWGIADGTVTFLLGFDPSSDSFRKNPLGAVEAFQRAFRPDDPVFLLIKINWSKQKRTEPRKEDGEILKLKAAAESDRRIRIVEDRLSYAEVLSLYASADVIVSLHRAEGLGLHLMEAMSLGKPVVATGWSGNMDFMSRENSCIVGFQLGRVRSDRRGASVEATRPGQVWAEPDIDEAAAWMRRLAGNSELRSAVGNRAAQAMHEWTIAANSSSPFLGLDESNFAGIAGRRPQGRSAFDGLIWRHRIRHRLLRWKRRASSVLRAASLRA